MSHRQKKLEAKARRLEHVKEVCRGLIVAAKELNQARDEFRGSVSRLMGCSTEGWTLKELDEYFEGIKANIKSRKEEREHGYHENVGHPPG